MGSQKHEQSLSHYSLGALQFQPPGRLLGRCHAAQGNDTLACAALDAALEGSRSGELLFSESLSVKERQKLGSASGGSSSGPHWSAEMGRERVLEVMGRMTDSTQLLEKLLLHEL